MLMLLYFAHFPLKTVGFLFNFPLTSFLVSHPLNFLFLSLICRPYWRCYYSNTDAVIYVVDSSDRDRMGISKSELVAMLEVSWLILLGCENI